jgi:hypothetical protein
MLGIPMNNMTDRVRVVGWSLTSITVLVAAIGWLFKGMDPTPLLGFAALPGSIVEGSAVGKRATFKAEAVQTEVES